MTGPVNIHATAIVVGTTGLLFVGESGSGKSAMAFSCIAAARRDGLFAALVADDQTFISQFGDQIVAEQPPSIAGLIELRGSGIASVGHLTAGVMHYAVRPLAAVESQRLPPEGEIYPLPGRGALPLLRLAVNVADPWAILSAFLPGLSGPGRSSWR